MIQNTSIEGANDEAIEDAATRIHAASRPHRMNADSNLSHIFVADEKNNMVASLLLYSSDDNSDETSTCDGDNSTNSTSTSDNSAEVDSIESNLLYLEEKKQILKKAKLHMEKEKAYITLNAHRIANGRDPPSRRSTSPSIWSEAKAMVEEFKLDGVGGIRIDSEEGSSSEMVSSTINDSELRGSLSSHVAPDMRQPHSTSSSSSLDTWAKNTSRTRKRRKIDISRVKHISSAEYARECAGNDVEATATDDRDDGGGTTKRSSTRQHFMSPTGRCQQASEIQRSMDPRKWISQAVAKQIFALTHAAISEHRRSITGAGKGE